MDSRAAARFNGEVDEPRAGLRRGHITGSKNIPFNEFIAEDGSLKKRNQIAKILNAKDIDTARPIINTCGSGMTACINELALKVAGAESTFLYDGSWSEYGAIEEPNFEESDFDKPGKKD